MSTKVIDAQSMATNIRSKLIELRAVRAGSLFLKWTGTPTGTFAFYGSNTALKNKNPQTGLVGVDGDFEDVSSWLDSVPSAAGAAGQAMVNLDAFLGLEVIEVRYTASSGTGSLDGHVALDVAK